MVNIPEVEFEEVSGRDGNLGLITLTRQQALNALNQPMIRALDQQLIEWEAANHIKAVVIRAAPGRAFCAGGDIKSVYDRKKANDSTITDFFRDEYTMNSRIHNYSKPYIALLDGITMGGGVGISVHASHRVATDKLLFAMPETGIGFYPDVGVTYVLSRLPHFIGYYLGLTGARLGLNDCLELGLVDYAVQAEQFPQLIYALADASLESDSYATVTDVLSRFAVTYRAGKIAERAKLIAECFDQATVGMIMGRLANHSDEWCKEVLAILDAKSPTSLKVTLRALQEAAKLDFNDAIQMEYRISEHFVDHHDFFEGIRAVLVDKDQKPQWQPASLAEVMDAMVAEYFAPVERELELVLQGGL